MTEEWKDIQGYEGRYQVSNLGRVRSVEREYIAKDRWGNMTTFRKKAQILNGTVTKSGYVVVNIRTDNGKFVPRFVHVLVAKAFVPGYAEGLDVNHKDENKQNNRADNLEWVTRKANNNHGTHNARVSATLSKDHPDVEQLSLSGFVIATFQSVSTASKATGISKWQIRHCCKGTPRYQTAGGYRWRYKNKE